MIQFARISGRFQDCPRMAQKLYIETLGCQMNEYDSAKMRDVLEAILTAAKPASGQPAAIDAATLAEIDRYTKLFWINTGPYNNLTARKFVLKCTPEQLLAAAKAAG